MFCRSTKEGMEKQDGVLCWYRTFPEFVSTQNGYLRLCLFCFASVGVLIIPLLRRLRNPDQGRGWPREISLETGRDIPA